ncbi:Imm1 family immunity protein [Streptomyces sp. SID13031]|uniref:Imm1 family immunity protein n=1 Tax=Streptomyces sp. SID13031 TaxID=2706046 RepID=UPI0013CA51FF|nr:Imm1 family immunity protein [Streptomyces sp. SID13031]NEA35724.1 hypothetical protein [Streptomyces sp. SID13031]
MSYSIEAYYRHEHDDRPVVIRTDADVERLVDDLLAESFDHTMAALYLAERPRTEQGYPDHDFRVGINAERKVGGIKFAGTVEGSAGVWYAAGALAQHDEVVYEYAGHPETLPLDSELCLDQIRLAVKDFLRSGGERPASITWQAWPVNVA